MRYMWFFLAIVGGGFGLGGSIVGVSRRWAVERRWAVYRVGVPVVVLRRYLLTGDE